MAGRPKKNLNTDNQPADKKLSTEVFGPNLIELIKRYKTTGKVDYPVLNKQQEQELIFMLKDKDPAELKKRLILHNIKMVFNMAKKYMTKTNDFDDMVARGMYGLSVAAEKFDIKKNIKFSTYAYRWIFKYVVKEFYDKEYKVTSKSLSIDAPLSSLPDAGDSLNFENMLTKQVIDPTCEYASVDCTEIDSTSKNLEKYKDLSSQISNYVKTSAEFTPKDHLIYDRVLAGGEAISKFAKSEKLSSSFVSERLSFITGAIKKMLKTEFSLENMADVYAW